MRTLAAAVSLLAVVALSGCSQDDAQDAVDQAKDAASSAVSDADIQLPDVDWSKYGDKLQGKIDELAASADCESLQKELTDRGKLDSDVTAYIKAKLEQAGCS